MNIKDEKRSHKSFYIFNAKTGEMMFVFHNADHSHEMTGEIIDGDLDEEAKRG
jgi:hypothetical protein